MSSHGPHPPTHEHGLADGCERCAEHAERPLDALDDVNLGHLIDRVLDGSDDRSDVERTARIGVEQALRAGQKLARFPRARDYMLGIALEDVR